MKYSVDQINDDVVVLENILNNEKIEVKKECLPEIKEGSILKYEDNQYILDREEEKVRRENIKNRFERLRKKR